jgi:hypothetical protein
MVTQVQGKTTSSSSNGFPVQSHNKEIMEILFREHLPVVSVVVGLGWTEFDEINVAIYPVFSLF